MVLCRHSQKERVLHMNAFDKIIGYSSLKKELMQISDTLKNRQFYDKLGVSAAKALSPSENFAKAPLTSKPNGALLTIRTVSLYNVSSF